MFTGFFRGVLDFMLPPVCVSCQNPLSANEKFICRNCSSSLVRFGSAHPWREAEISRGDINNSFSLYRFIKDSPIQHMLHSMKYEKMRSIGLVFGKEIADNLPGDIKFDHSVPVPLHIARKRERTFNQSEFICMGTGVPVLPGLIKRKRFTRSQTKLDKHERAENVKDAFEISSRSLINGKNILLIDDVITTGATILECARLLKRNGAGYIMICSAAYDALE